MYDKSAECICKCITYGLCWYKPPVVRILYTCRIIIRPLQLPLVVGRNLLFTKKPSEEKNSRTYTRADAPTVIDSSSDESDSVGLTTTATSTRLCVNHYNTWTAESRVEMKRKRQIKMQKMQIIFMYVCVKVLSLCRLLVTHTFTMYYRWYVHSGKKKESDTVKYNVHMGFIDCHVIGSLAGNTDI